jgi:NADH-quinone oxidoreductase subunit M
MDGAMYQNLAHGISTGGLFLCVGILYERRHTRRLEEFGGIWQRMPVYGAFLLILTMASVGLPGLSGFVGEFLVILGTFSAERSMAGLPPSLFVHAKLLAGVCALGVVLGAVYMLWLFQRMMFGPLSNPLNRKLKDLSPREVFVLLPMLVMAFWLGIYPSTFLKDIDPAVVRTIAAFKQKYAAKPSADGPRMLDAENNIGSGGDQPNNAHDSAKPAAK